jgi:glycine dehydrogenase subunit 1
MPYIPNTDDDRRLMLERIGAAGIDDLFGPIPPAMRLKEPLRLPSPLTEMELLSELEAISCQNKCPLTVFAGGGVYDHFIPAAVSVLSSRPEFVTAYTPYQAEVSQGTLQVIYEFQTHICRLTGMDAANASMYDGASAAAEAALLALGRTARSKVLLSETINPLFREVIKTYLSGRDTELIIIPHRGGETDFDRMESAVDDETACVILSQPNFFGIVEDIEIGSQLVHRHGGLLVAVIDPVAAAVLRMPADYGADIVVGEAQPLGIPMNFGGPLLGFFAVRKELIRLLPGRLAAKTEDEAGRTGFVLTLQTREQHIRREKATSNICTNQALCATMATIYMSLMGKYGLRQAALLSMERAHQAAEKIKALAGFDRLFEGSFIREFVLKTPIPARILIDRLIDRESILPGLDLGRYYSGMDNCLMVAFTEKRSVAEVEKLCNALKEHSFDAVLPHL